MVRLCPQVAETENEIRRLNYRRYVHTRNGVVIAIQR